MTPEKIKALEEKIAAKKLEQAEQEKILKKEEELLEEAKTLGIDTEEYKNKEKKNIQPIVEEESKKKKEVEKKDEHTSITQEDLKEAAISAGKAAAQAIAEASKVSKEKEETKSGGIYG